MEADRLAAIYTRVSTLEQAKGDHLSLKTQMEPCLDKATRELRCVVPDDARFRVEETHTGKDLRWRGSMLSALLKLAHTQAFQVLVVYRHDRFGRAGSRKWMKLYDAFEEAGVEIRFVLNDIPPGPAKRGILTIMADMAQEENNNRVDATMRQKRARVDAGFPLVGPRPPYGYAYVLAPADARGHQRKLGLQPDPDTAPIVVLIFERVAAGWTLRKLAAQLDADNVPPPRAAAGMAGAGHRWHAATLKRIVTDPTYWGERMAFRYAYTERDEQEREAQDLSTYRQMHDRLRTDPHSPDLKQLPTSTCPGLVSKELAMQVHARLADNSRYGKRNGRRYTDADVLLYGGIVRCLACGRVMGPRQQSLAAAHGNPEKRAWMYVCHRGRTDSMPCPAGGTKITAAQVDTFVWQEAVRLIRDPDYFEQLMRESADLFAPKAELARAERALANADKQLSAMWRKLTQLEEEEKEGDEDAALIRESALPTLKQLSRERADAEADYERARIAVEEEELRRATVRAFREWAQEQANADGQPLEGLPPERRRNIVLALHPRVFIAPTAYIDWAYRIDVVFDFSNDPNAVRHLDTSSHGQVQRIGPPVHQPWGGPFYQTVGSDVILPGQVQTFSIGAAMWDSKGRRLLPPTPEERLLRGPATPTTPDEIAVWRGILEQVGYRVPASAENESDPDEGPPITLRSW